ncbi:MAG: TonB-dependent receptor [Acidobacteriota bacterium]
MKASALRLIVLVALVLASSTAMAQDTASLSGTVASGDGTALPSATVTLTNKANVREVSTTTDAEGHFEITGLVPGRYRMTVSLQGFNEVSRNVSLDAGATEQDVKLRVGTITEEITVTAAKGIERETAAIPQVVTIITSEDLEERQVASVAHAIERAPNIRTIDQNPTRARPQFRGLASSRVLILVDGERLNNVRFDAGATGISPSMIDVTQVESIEVLGGAGSGIYGTDAMAGVINIVTKQPTQSASGNNLDIDLDLSYNENSEYFKGVLTGSYSTPKFALRAIYSDFELDGWTAGDGGVTRQQVVQVAEFAQEVAAATGGDVTNSFAIWEFPNGTQVFNAQGEGFNLQADLWLYPSDDHSIRLKYLTSQHENLGLPFSIPPTDPTVRFNTFRDLTKITALYETYDVAPWLSRLSFRAYSQNFERPQDDNRFNIDAGSSYNPATSTFTGNLSTFTRGREQSTLNNVDSTGFEFQANIQPWTKAVLTTGLSWLNDESSDVFDFETFDPSGQVVTYGEQGVATTPDTEYENQAFFAVLEWWPTSKLRFDGGIRYDKWETEAKPSDTYPPVQETTIIQTALPLLQANPGDINLAGINGLDSLLDGTSGISTDNDVWTGNLGVTILTEAGINPYIRWAQSYREPEVTVRYLIRNFGSPFFFVTGLPNTELQAEEGETLDIGVKFDRPNWRGTLGYFENDIENFIGTTLSDTVFSFGFIRPDLGLLSPVGIFFQRINFGEVSYEGWEASFEGSFALSGNRGTISPYFQLSHLISENKTPTADDLTTVRQFYNRNDTPRRFEGSENDVPFGNVVEDQGLFGVRYTAPSTHWFVEYELKWVDDISRVDPGDLATPNTTQFGSFSSLDGYERHTLRGGYEFAEASVPVRINVAIENLSDKFYFDPFQLAPAPGRSFVASLHIPWRNLLGN